MTALRHPLTAAALLNGYARHATGNLSASALLTMAEHHRAKARA